MSVNGSKAAHRLLNSTIFTCWALEPCALLVVTSSNLTIHCIMVLNNPASVWCMRSGGRQVVGSKKGCLVQNGCHEKTNGDDRTPDGVKQTQYLSPHVPHGMLLQQGFGVFLEAPAGKNGIHAPAHLHQASLCSRRRSGW
jgi:putative hemolysin